MLTLSQLADKFPTDDACYEYLVSLRWPEGASCPSCGSSKVYRLKGGKSRRWVCKSKDHAKNYNFSALVGTIFENTNFPLRTWFQTILLMCQAKRGISTLQIQRTLGLVHVPPRALRDGEHRLQMLMGVAELTRHTSAATTGTATPRTARLWLTRPRRSLLLALSPARRT